VISIAPRASGVSRPVGIFVDIGAPSRGPAAVPGATWSPKTRIPATRPGPRAREGDAGAVRRDGAYTVWRDVFAETGDPGLLSALERIWQDNDAERRCMSPGPSAAYRHGLSPRVDRVHGFGWRTTLRQRRRLQRDVRQPRQRDVELAPAPAHRRSLATRNDGTGPVQTRPFIHERLTDALLFCNPCSAVRGCLWRTHDTGRTLVHALLLLLSTQRGRSLARLQHLATPVSDDGALGQSLRQQHAEPICARRWGGC